jgi:hypothetical protein
MGRTPNPDTANMVSDPEFFDWGFWNLTAGSFIADGEGHAIARIGIAGRIHEFIAIAAPARFIFQVNVIAVGGEGVLEDEATIHYGNLGALHELPAAGQYTFIENLAANAGGFIMLQSPVYDVDESGFLVVSDVFFGLFDESMFGTYRFRPIEPAKFEAFDRPGNKTEFLIASWLDKTNCLIMVDRDEI